MKNKIPQKSFQEQGSSFVIYGAGNSGRDVLRILKEKGKNVVAFIDEKAGSFNEVDGIPCISIKDDNLENLLDYPVILAIYNGTVDCGLIEKNLINIGFDEVISYYHFYEQYPELVKSVFWLSPRDSYKKNRELEKVHAILDDDKSKKIFADIIKLRTTFDLQILRSPEKSNQYIPENIPFPSERIRFVDGGCFIGDTIEALLANGITFEAIACFEPELGNFSRASTFISQRLSSQKQACIFPCGLGEKTEMHRFISGQGAASSISDGGDSFIQVVALDDVLPSFAPTYIKLDVEGAEAASLLGAKKTIQKYRPALAVCLYHKPEDLWELPLLIAELTPNYSYFLRYHGYNGFEVVLYAIPKEICDVKHYL